ncbi:MAG: ROK family protein, partial [Halanaerobiales bacterium]
AGEAGHMTIMPDGPLCGCGNYGCFEALASGTAIAHRGREAGLNNRSPELKKLSQDEIDLIDARMVAKAAYNGDQMAKEIFTRTGYYLGIGLANLVNLFNPELILFGGGVIRARDLFWESMKESLEKRVLISSYRDLEMKNAELGDKTGLMGAIAVAMERDRQSY